MQANKQPLYGFTTQSDPGKPDLVRIVFAVTGFNLGTMIYFNASTEERLVCRHPEPAIGGRRIPFGSGMWLVVIPRGFFGKASE